MALEPALGLTSYTIYSISLSALILNVLETTLLSRGSASPSPAPETFNACEGPRVM